jgi:hypothetical protein
MSDLILSPADLVALSGGYKRPRDQVAELHRRGFARARIGKVTGKVILERAHLIAALQWHPEAWRRQPDR